MLVVVVHDNDGASHCTVAPTGLQGRWAVKGEELVDSEGTPRPLDLVRATILLLLCERPCHGYVLVNGLVCLGLDFVTARGVYRTLGKLEESQLVDSSWETSSDGVPARRTYSITDAGRRSVDNTLPAMKSALASIDAMLDRSDRLDCAG